MSVHNPWEETIHLAYPITRDGVIQHTLQFRHPRVIDVENVVKQGKSDFEAAINLAANLTMMAPDEVRQLHMKDFMQIRDKITDFLGGPA